MEIPGVTTRRLYKIAVIPMNLLYSNIYWVSQPDWCNICGKKNDPKMHHFVETIVVSGTREYAETKHINLCEDCGDKFIVYCKSYCYVPWTCGCIENPNFIIEISIPYSFYLTNFIKTRID